MASRKKIIDTTLREGQQTPGLHFSCEQKMVIIDHLVAVGVDEVELGVSSAFTEDLQELISYCREKYPKLSLALWSRCNPADISHAISLKPDVLSLSIPVSDSHIYDKMGKNKSWVKQVFVAAVTQLSGSGVNISIGFEDATRAEKGFLFEMMDLAVSKDVFRVRIADTVGICSPAEFSTLISGLSDRAGSTELATHTHNDFGMATANAISGLESGANWADTTILGLGERAGCARLEEVAAYLSVRREQENINLLGLKNFVVEIEAWGAVVVPPNQPIVGSRIFDCETGLHLHGLHKNSETYEPFSPALLGRSRNLLMGAKIGKKALEFKIAELGLDLKRFSEKEVGQAVENIRRRAISSKRSIADDELLEIMGV